MRLLDAPPADGNGNDTKPTPPAPVPPGSAKIVAKTPIKTPNEIRMEKELAAMRDEVDGLKGWQGEVNSALEGLNVGALSAPVPVKRGTVKPAPAGADPLPKPARGFMDTINEDLWGTPNQV